MKHFQIDIWLNRKQAKIDAAKKNNGKKLIVDHPTEIAIQTLKKMPLDDMSNTIAASFGTSMIGVFVEA